MKLREKILLAVACLMLLTSATYLIFFDQWKFNSSHSETKLGIVGKKVNSLKRKAPDSLVWEEIEDTKDLFAGDKVFTPAESSATLQIGQASTIEMSSSTLIQLNQGMNNDISIELEDGSVNANLTKSDGIHSIQASGAVMELNSDSSTISLDTDKKSSLFSVLSGAIIITKAGNKIEMKQNEVADIGQKNGALKKQALSFRPLSPDLGSLVTQDQLKDLTFAWKSLKKAPTPKIVEMSKDKDFTKILFTSSTLRDSLVMDASGHGTGLYFWRVRYEDEKNHQAVTQRFNVFNHYPVKLFSPTSDQNIILPFDKTTADLSFDWEETPGATFLFELGLREEKEVKLLKTQEAQAPKITITNLRPAKYWWRVQKKMTGLSPLWSVKSTFEIVPSDRPVLASYTSPANFKIIDSNDQSITFKWQGNPKNQYLLSIARDPNFKNLTLEQNVSNGSYTWPITTLGKLYWKVTHQSINGPPAVWTFTIPSGPIELKYPKEKSLHNILRPGEKIHFEWNHSIPEYISSETRSYELVIYQGPKEVTRIRSQNTKHEWAPLASGNYKWRVETPGGVSDMSHFSVEFEPFPLPPKVKKEMRLKIKKRKGAMLDLYENRSEMLSQLGLTADNYVKNEVFEAAEVKWDEIKEANEYHFEIYKDSSGKDLLLSRKAKSSPFIWKKAPQGTFFFRLSYTDKFGRKSPFSELSKVIIEGYREENQRVRLNYPSHKFISHSDRQGFEWEPFDDADSYQLTIKNFKSHEIIFEKKTNSLSHLTPLPPGLYRWKIMAYEGSNKIASSEERAFKILDPSQRGSLKNPLNNPYNRNFLKGDFIFGSIHANSEVNKSGELFESNETISQFPGTYSLSVGQNIGRERFLNGKLGFQNGYNKNISYSSLNFGGNWNWYAATNQDWTFFWGPGMKYSSISLVSDSSSKTVGATLNFVSLTFQGTVSTSFKSFDTWKHSLNIQGGYSFLNATATTAEINYDVRKTKIGLLRPWASFYEKVFFHVGLGYNSNTITTNGNSLNMVEWRIPIGLGLYHDL